MMKNTAELWNIYAQTQPIGSKIDTTKMMKTPTTTRRDAMPCVFFIALVVVLRETQSIAFLQHSRDIQFKTDD
ncbi:MAG: hypothetical protein WCJ03_02320 [Bacteroidales bacterium]